MLQALAGGAASPLVVPRLLRVGEVAELLGGVMLARYRYWNAAGATALGKSAEASCHDESRASGETISRCLEVFVSRAYARL